MTELDQYGKRHEIVYVECLDDGSYEFHFALFPHLMPEKYGPGEEPYEFLHSRLQLKPGQTYFFKREPLDISNIK